jgi:hypothetical protein
VVSVLKSVMMISPTQEADLKPLDNYVAKNAEEPYRNRYGTDYQRSDLINFKAVVGNKIARYLT